MNCKLSWIYPNTCQDEKDGICNSDKNCEWKTEQSFDEYIADHENDDSI